MYPLNVNNPSSGGYAVANNEDEHKALSSAGYLPAFPEEAPVEAVETSVPAEDVPVFVETVKRGPGRPRKVE